MNRDTNALDALSYVAMKVCTLGAYAIILAAIFGYFTVSP